MTILPKKKQSKDKPESNEGAGEHPHSPAGGTVEGRAVASSRHPGGSPGQSRWGSPPPALDPMGASGGIGHEDVGGASGGSTLHVPVGAVKRRLRDRSPPHRSTRKQRHDSSVSQRPSTAGYGRQGLLRGQAGAAPSSEVVRPCQVAPIGVMPGGAAGGSELEESSNGYNSEDECQQAARQTSETDNELLERWFETRLKEKRGFTIKKMGEDGACLFRCVADQVFGDQEMHSVVRHNCVDYMAKNGDFFKQYVTEDFNMYLTRKRVDHCHGNHIEMQALSELYNRPIEVYQARFSEHCHKPINTFHGAYKTDNDPIRLSYHQNIHYNSVIDPYKASVGVGLGLPGFQPGLADKNLIKDAVRLSEDCQIEQTMLEDKLRETDWEVTQETIEEQVARESYLQWLKDQEKRDNSLPSSSATRSACASCSTAAEGSSSTAAAAAATGSSSWFDSPETSRPARSPRSGSSSSAPDPASANQRSPPRVNDGESCSDAFRASTSFSSISLPRGLRNEPQFSQPGPSTSSSGLSLSGMGGATGGATGGEGSSQAYEVSSELYCLSEFEDEDAILARVMAESQQEYYNSLKRSAEHQLGQADIEHGEGQSSDEPRCKDGSKGKSRMPRGGGDPKF